MQVLPLLVASDKERCRAWRLRRDVACQLGRLAAACPPEAVAEVLWPCAIALCQDPVAAVRSAAAANIGGLVGSLGPAALQPLQRNECYRWSKQGENEGEGPGEGNGVSSSGMDGNAAPRGGLAGVEKGALGKPSWAAEVDGEGRDGGSDDDRSSSSNGSSSGNRSDDDDSSDEGPQDRGREGLVGLSVISPTSSLNGRNSSGGSSSADSSNSSRTSSLDGGGVGLKQTASHVLAPPGLVVIPSSSASIPINQNGYQARSGRVGGFSGEESLYSSMSHSLSDELDDVALGLPSALSPPTFPSAMPAMGATPTSSMISSAGISARSSSSSSRDDEDEVMNGVGLGGLKGNSSSDSDNDVRRWRSSAGGDASSGSNSDGSSSRRDGLGSSSGPSPPLSPAASLLPDPQAKSQHSSRKIKKRVSFVDTPRPQGDKAKDAAGDKDTSAEAAAVPVKSTSAAVTSDTSSSSAVHGIRKAGGSSSAGGSTGGTSSNSSAAAVLMHPAMMPVGYAARQMASQHKRCSSTGDLRKNIESASSTAAASAAAAAGGQHSIRRRSSTSKLGRSSSAVFDRPGESSFLELHQQAAALDPKKAQPGHWVESLVWAFGHGKSYQLRQLFVPMALGTLAKAGGKLAGWQQQQLWETLRELAQDEVPTVRASVAVTLESSSSSTQMGAGSSSGCCSSGGSPVGGNPSSAQVVKGAPRGSGLCFGRNPVQFGPCVLHKGAGLIGGVKNQVSASACSQWQRCAADAVNESLRILSGSEQLQQLLDHVSTSATQTGKQ